MGWLSDALNNLFNGDDDSEDESPRRRVVGRDKSGWVYDDDPDYDPEPPSWEKTQR